MCGPFSTSPQTVKRNLPRILLALASITALAPAGAEERLVVLGLFRDRAVVQIGEQRRVLRAGETSPEGVKLVSASPREAVIEIDGERGTYPLGGHISTRFDRAEDRGPSLQLWPDRDGTYSTTGSINGFPVAFLVDTGASKVAMNALEATRLGIDYRVVGTPALAATASGVVRSYEVVLARVKVGEIELTNVPAGVLDGPHPREVLLGMSFLEQLDMTREGKRLELRKRR
jgi:aspartyl protease family protein